MIPVLLKKACKETTIHSLRQAEKTAGFFRPKSLKCNTFLPYFTFFGNRCRNWYKIALYLSSPGPYLMDSKKTPLFFLFLFVSFFGIDGQAVGGGSSYVKKSLAQVKEGNLNEAAKTFQRARAKNEDDFGLDFVVSVYFLSPYQKTLKLDSSYFFCLSAIEKFKKESPSGKLKYVKLNIDSAELFSRKDYLDSLGFSQAERLESEAAYQYFLEKFPQSRLAEEARQKRVSLAFQRAKKENSYEAFMAFLDRYPDAEQARTAKEISDLLVFENTAKKGKIADWENFIEKNPNNPYVLKAQNRIFELSTLEHNPVKYKQFIDRYPANPNVSKAWEWIFFLEKNAKSPAELAGRYPGFPSLQFDFRFNLRGENLITFIERGKFGLMLRQGKTLIKPNFDSIPEDYRCEPVWAGFVKIFKNRKASIFCLDSFPVSDGEFDDAEWFAEGMLKTNKNGKQGLISMTGSPILGCRYESILRLNQNLLSIQQGNRYFLFTTKGQKIDLPQMDEVLSAGRFILLRSGNKYCLAAENEILKSQLNEPPNLEFMYSGLEKPGDKKLILFHEKGLIFLYGNKIIPLPAGPKASFSDCPWGIIVAEEDGVFSVDTLGNVLPGKFKQVVPAGNHALVKSGDRFGIMGPSWKKWIDFQYDTIFHLLRNSFMGRRGDKKYLIFESGKTIGFPLRRNPEVLHFPGVKGNPGSYFIVLTDSLDRKAVFNKSGKQLLPFQYEQIDRLDAQLFALQSGRKTGIADTSGRILIKPSLTGASPLNRDYICTAKGKSFSILNPFTKKTIPAELTAIARPYGQIKWLFIVRVRDRAGLMDASGKMIIPAVYEDLMYWNPTRCLVKKNGYWYFYLIESGKELVKAMKSIAKMSERENETIYLVEADKKVGLESTLSGELSPTDSDEIVPFEWNSHAVFFAGRRVQSSSVYNLSYVDQNGQLIKTQLLTEAEYERIVCD